MKIEPYLVASTVNVIIAQRLVRKICQKCRFSKEINKDEPIISNLSIESKKTFFENKDNIRIYQGKGCPVCHMTGYQDRIGIFEVLVMDDEIRQAVIEKKDSGIIRKIAHKNGMKLMIEDGLEKVKEGITSIEEIVRVTKE
jgi:type II secretory ATPase GspE/PulE/Tfp pilus assembly ATPase PilB-like protein